MRERAERLPQSGQPDTFHRSAPACVDQRGQPDPASSLRVLTASVAHEVNQPLSGIITNASTCLRMLNADPPNLDGARETARRTLRDANRAAEIVSRLRALFTKMPMATEPVDLNEAVLGALALSRCELEASQVTVRCALADRQLLLVGDSVQLQQVIQNLVRNAAEAMKGLQDRSRELAITTRHGENLVQLSVRDTGIGFRCEDTDRLFAPFYTTKTNGMGIGLSVSRSIVERHGGQLWGAPNDDGPGATFSLSIPCASARLPRHGPGPLHLVSATDALALASGS